MLILNRQIVIADGFSMAYKIFHFKNLFKKFYTAIFDMIDSSHNF